ncbi:hypothetical protein GE061_006920 [Apolygus lucorum]|uniref:Uncharacterized protein n=1 Tax=Apolygus lucorum TaxID=248454 RepID=A0A8S9WQH0_APOLU|nr:hypothetical protein GE061_006920 [Apolygus lucorum]
MRTSADSQARRVLDGNLGGRRVRGRPRKKWLEDIESDLNELGDIPLHVSTLTLLLIAWDRYRFLKDPMKPRIPAFVCATGSWLTAICLVLPYPIYTTYIDLGGFWNPSLHTI